MRGSVVIDGDVVKLKLETMVNRMRPCDGRTQLRILLFTRTKKESTVQHKEDGGWSD